MNNTYLQVTGRPSCVWRLFLSQQMMEFDVNWFLAICDSCRLLCSSESFMTVDDISVNFSKVGLCYVT